MYEHAQTSYWTASIGHGLNETFQKVMAWVTLPDLIFSDIMMMVGLESLHRCRQVCKTWNEMILRDIRKMKERIEKNWDPKNWRRRGKFPTDKEISHAKWLGDGCVGDIHFKYHPFFDFRS